MRTTQKGWGKASGRKAMLLLGMSAMALAFVAMMTGCGDSGGGGGGTPPPQAAAPTATPAAGAVVSGTTVTLSSADGAAIYYTTDGNTPTASSTRYSSPITVTAAVTIKAIAVKSGMTDSEVLSAAYTIITPTVIITADNLNTMTSLIAAESSGTSRADPIVVKVTIADASLLSGNNSGGTDTLHKLFDAIPSGKYVAYDLSGCTFTSIGDTYIATAYARTNKAYLASIALPDTLISIGNEAFWGCSGLTSVTIPNSVTSIGEGAFAGCSGLTSVIIPNSVTSIGDGAFYDCSGLNSVTIPSSVTSIGDGAFYDCSGLNSIYVLRYTEPLTTLEGSDAFAGTHTDLRINVPSGVVNTYKGMDNWSDYESQIQAGSPSTP